MPYFITMLRAMEVAVCRSLEAPVEISPRTNSSATRPPRQVQMRSWSSCRDWYIRSSSGREMVMPPAWPRGTMVIWVTGS